MTEILGLLTIVAFAIALPISVVAWVRVIYYGFKTTTELKPNAPSRFNRFNVLLQPDDLNEKGHEYRKKTGKYIVLFVGSMLFVFILAYFTGLIKWQ